MTNLTHPVRRRTRDAYPVLRPKPERIVVTLFPGDTLIFRCERRRQEWYLPIAAAFRAVDHALMFASRMRGWIEQCSC